MAWKFLVFVNDFFLVGRNNLKKYKKHGSWALVTGASDGIGRGYAEELAKRGFNVVISARTASKLEEFRSELLAKNSAIQVKVLPFDYSTRNDADYEKLYKELELLDISVLVNNVGVNFEIPCVLTDGTDAESDNMIFVNCLSTTRLTKKILPGMVSRRGGAIINLSSFVADRVTPMLSVYCGSKAYMKAFSEALSVEYASKGIDVLSVHPYYVISKMSGFKKPSFTVITPNRLAQDSFKYLGRKRAFIVTMSHYLMDTVVGMLPTSYLMNLSMGQMKGVRARQLKKKARSAESSKPKTK